MDQSIEKLFVELENIIEKAKEDAIKFDKGKNSPGTRVRAVMQELIGKAKQVRVQVSATKAERKAEQ